MQKLLRFTGYFAFASLIFAISLVSYDYTKTRSAFPPNTFIGKVEVSALTQKEAVAKLKSLPLSEILAALITFEAESKRFTFTLEELGVKLLAEQTVKNAFEMAHRENYLEELKERILREGIYAPLFLDIEEKQLTVALKNIDKKVRSSAKDATIVFYEETGGYNIESDEPAREVNIEKSITAFREMLQKGERSVQLVIDYTYPRIREKDLRTHPPVYRISAYTTFYGRHDSPNRIHNIKLIASWMDGTLLMPGDIFSVADLIGEFTPEKGFKEAFVIYDGVLVPMFGGGTCQIGTTLYNTVALADLKILQRRNHSFYFNIYPLGRDATVYPGQVDFKFQNDSGHPILIKAVATNKRLSFRIYGTPTGKKVEFSSAAVTGLSESGNYVPMPLNEVIALDIPFKTMVTRTVYDKDRNQIKEEKIYSSYKLYGEKENVPIERPEPR